MCENLQRILLTCFVSGALLLWAASKKSSMEENILGESCIFKVKEMPTVHFRRVERHKNSNETSKELCE